MDPTKDYVESLQQAPSRSPGEGPRKGRIRSGGNSDSSSIQNNASSRPVSADLAPQFSADSADIKTLSLHPPVSFARKRSRPGSEVSEQRPSQFPVTGLGKDAGPTHHHSRKDSTFADSQKASPKYVPPPLRLPPQRRVAPFSPSYQVVLRSDAAVSPNVDPQSPPSQAVNVSRGAKHSPHEDAFAPQDFESTTPSSLKSPTTLSQDASSLDDQHSANVEMTLQPESLAISQNQLTDEVKGIYAGLILVEAKCIEVVSAEFKALREQANSGDQGDSSATPASIARLPALNSLHRTLLHEHHDFLLASQHPSASPKLQGLASRYLMPGRMWKHGIHSFLELLRHQLPHSLEYMLSFVILAYQMVGLLLETVPTFKDTWIECLGDLGRYRMAIEDDDQRDRDIWSNVSRYWYNKSVDRNPNIGRLYHHLAILSRSQPLQQLSLYCRAMVSNQPFDSAKESVKTMFEPILVRSESGAALTLSIDIWFLKSHALMYSGGGSDRINSTIHKYLSLLNNHVARVLNRWKEQGACSAISNISAILQYGGEKSALTQLLRQPASAANTSSDAMSAAISKEITLINGTKTAVGQAWHLSLATLSIILTRLGDKNTLPAIHIYLTFFVKLASMKLGVEYFGNEMFPWAELTAFLMDLAKTHDILAPPETMAFPIPEAGDRKPLPEDFLVRGLIWTNDYFPPGWFDGANTDYDERMMELASTARLRVERVLFLGMRLVRLCPETPTSRRWLQYDETTRIFTVTGDRVLEPAPSPETSKDQTTGVGPMPIRTIPHTSPRKPADRLRIHDANDIEMADAADHG